MGVRTFRSTDKGRLSELKLFGRTRRARPFADRFRPRRRVWAAAATAVFALDVVIPAVVAWQASLASPTFHMDGAFQTASGLFRLAEGELPGRDFLPYLGVGPLFLLFPVFALLGGSLAASVFAAHFFSLLALELVFLAVGAFFFRRKAALALSVAAALPLVLFAVLGLWPSLSQLNPVCAGCISTLTDAAQPGNSLRPIRAMAPYTLAIVAYALLDSTLSPRRQAVGIGVAGGVAAALWSNDYGIVGGVGLLATVTLMRLLQRQWPLRIVALSWLIGLVTYCVSGLIATAGHLLPLLAYNFSDVRQDQFWYYGPWIERVYTAGDLFQALNDEQALHAFVPLLITMVVAFITRRTEPALLSYVGLAMLLGGVTATVGGQPGGYFWTFRLWGVVMTAFCAVWMCVRFGERWMGKSAQPTKWRNAVHGSLVIALSLVLLVTALATWTVGQSRRDELANDPTMTFDSSLGGYIPLTYLDHLALADEGTPVVEEYAGILTAHTRSATNLPVDSTIHALGSQRAVFEARMATEPALVITTVPTMAPQWVSWNLSANWWFYRTLFRTYTPWVSSPTTVAWVAAEPAEWQSVDCRVEDGQVKLRPQASGLYEVAVRFAGPGGGTRSYTEVQTTLAPGSTAYVALDPAGSEQAFPVYVEESARNQVGDVTLNTRQTPSDRGALTEFTGCSAAQVHAPPGAETLRIFQGLWAGHSTPEHSPSSARM